MSDADASLGRPRLESFQPHIEAGFQVKGLEDKNATLQGSWTLLEIEERAPVFLANLGEVPSFTLVFHVDSCWPQGMYELKSPSGEISRLMASPTLAATGTPAMQIMVC